LRTTQTAGAGTSARLNTIAATALAIGAALSPALGAPCTNPDALGTSRTLVIDPSEHTRLGSMQYRETLPLGPREVVLTFDDGPLPPYSSRVLDALAAECVKATYFLVGSMARAHPELVRRIAVDGHTIGTHSQNHPFTFHNMSRARAEREISGGIASVSAALHGLKPAPFFRIPGLLRASSVEAYLASRGLITWSADVPSDDWRRISDTEIVRRTIARLEAHNGGMVLLHDIRPATALALPKLLRELKARGFRIVHVVPAGGPVVTTATAPGQWAVRAASRKPSVKRATRTRLAERRVKTVRSASLWQREAARRRASARMAVIREENPGPRRGLFDFSRRIPE
jgi:peptidoglycan/xylan/chitin deacetylase (PgdA/CDA1 family)